MSGDLSEQLRAASSGDEAAIAVIFRALHPPLLRYLRRKAPSAAEDLASETWLAAAQSLAGFTGSFGEFRALVFTIAHRRSVDHYRRLGRAPEIEMFAEDHVVAHADTDAADVALAGIGADEAIASLVRILPPVQAEIVLLRVLGDLSAEEIAAIVGKKPGAVRVLQHRALRRLSTHYRPHT